MSSDYSSQTLKPLTAAAKLGIYLPATPEEFRTGAITQATLQGLRENPPAWLIELREKGPFPRDTTARKLGISNKGLERGGVGDALTAAQIAELTADPPPWLITERATYTRVQNENARIAEAKAVKRAESNRPPKNR